MKFFMLEQCCELCYVPTYLYFCLVKTFSSFDHFHLKVVSFKLTFISMIVRPHVGPPIDFHPSFRVDKQFRNEFGDSKTEYQAC